MKKLILLAAATFLISCTTDSVQERPTPIQSVTTVNVCGTVVGVQTFGQVSPSMFIGVRYDMVLDMPYFDGTNYYSKAWFLVNDAQNTYTVQQYWTNPQYHYCGLIQVYTLAKEPVLSNGDVYSTVPSLHGIQSGFYN